MRLKILKKLPIIKTKTAIAIGVFDGVHIGHFSVISNVVNSAFYPVVLTFNFDRGVPSSKKNFLYILSSRKKFELLNKLGVKLIVSLSFEDVKKLSFDSFFENVLVRRLNAKLIVCGENLRFGFNRQGSLKDLKFLAMKNNVDVVAVNLIKLQGFVVSSSRVRLAIENADFDLVFKMLGRRYEMEFYFKFVKCCAGVNIFKKNLNEKFVTPRKGKYLVFARILNKTYLVTLRIVQCYDRKILCFKILQNLNLSSCYVKIIFIRKIC